MALTIWEYYKIKDFQIDIGYDNKLGVRVIFKLRKNEKNINQTLED
mgnify:CR=1 FL=1